MKRNFAFGTLLALILVLSISASAMAAGPGPNAAALAEPGTGQGAALYGVFVDADGNGICDSYETRIPLLDGSGNQWGGGQATPGANFVDADGDGVCDNCAGDGVPALDGSGRQQAPRGRWNR